MRGLIPLAGDWGFREYDPPCAHFVMLQVSFALSCCGAGEKLALGRVWSYREHEPPLARAPHDASGVPGASELKCPPMAPKAPGSWHRNVRDNSFRLLVNILEVGR